MRKFLLLLIFVPNLLSGQNIINMNAEEFFNTSNSFLKNSSVIVDGRTSEMFNSGHIKNAINIDAFKPEAEKMLMEFLDKKTIVIYCTMNNRSLKLIDILKTNNFKGDIIDITDGITGWKEKGFEVVTEIPTENTNNIQTNTTFKPFGKTIVQVFGNFDYNATQDAQKQYGFWFGRAHFGYEYQFSKQFSGRIIIDAGRPTTVGQIVVTDTTGHNLNTSNSSKEGSYYTMILKFASLEWKPNEHIKIQAGGVLQNHYITQEKFWGYRYVAPTFQDKYYGMPSGDLGMIGYFKINEKLGFDLALTNGEGFRFDQDAYGDVKIASGVDYYPVKGLQTRIYCDFTQSNNPLKPSEQILYSIFAGYKLKKKFRIGSEFNYRQNHLNITNHNLYGYSVFGAYAIYKEIELFARFDKLQANTLNNDVHNWYFQHTGTEIISGIHYKAADVVNISIHYESWKPDDASVHVQHHVLLSFEYKL